MREFGDEDTVQFGKARLGVDHSALPRFDPIVLPCGAEKRKYLVGWGQQVLLGGLDRPQGREFVVVAHDLSR